MDVKIALVGRPPVGGAVLRLDHLRNVPFKADRALGLLAHGVPIRSGIVSRDGREGEEVGEGQRLVVCGDFEAVLLLRQIAVLSRMLRKGGGGDTTRDQPEAEDGQGHAAGPMQAISPGQPSGPTGSVLPMSQDHITLVAVTSLWNV